MDIAKIKSSLADTSDITSELAPNASYDTTDLIQLSKILQDEITTANKFRAEIRARFDSIESMIEKTPTRTYDRLIKKGTNKGIIVAKDDLGVALQSEASAIFATYESKLESLLKKYFPFSISVPSNAPERICDLNAEKPIDLGRIPDSFTFPSLNISQLWDAWFRGSTFKDPDTNVLYLIKPLHLYSAGDFKIKKDQNMLSKCRKVIHFLVGDLESNVLLLHRLQTEKDDNSWFYNELDRLFVLRFGVNNIKASIKVSTIFDKISTMSEAKRTYKRNHLLLTESSAAVASSSPASSSSLSSSSSSSSSSSHPALSSNSINNPNMIHESNFYSNSYDNTPQGYTIDNDISQIDSSSAKRNRVQD
jgi:hypothetical protein